LIASQRVDNGIVLSPQTETASLMAAMKRSIAILVLTLMSSGGAAGPEDLQSAHFACEAEKTCYRLLLTIGFPPPCPEDSRSRGRGGAAPPKAP